MFMVIETAGRLDEGCVELLDLTGRLVRKLSLTGRTTLVETSDLEDGIYTYRVLHEHGQLISGRVMICH
jgi:hypothetical protein